jgi:2-amino-4-hydroxy-6-hydroxymethyldihydropteridine diphosphokinase
MGMCLIALGSNLGDRASHMRRAINEIAQLPHTRLAARSAWNETSPVGGPAGQGAFLNGAALVATSLAPLVLLAELRRIEAMMGRARTVRWEARTLDLDILLYDELVTHAAELDIPHPRMHYRRFVLTPAADVAPWMIHAESRWTVARLLDQLDRGASEIVLAGGDAQRTDRLVGRLCESVGPGPCRIRRWAGRDESARFRPKLILAVRGPTGSDPSRWRKMLHLPATGPVAWVSGDSTRDALQEALTAIDSACPELRPR